MHRRFRQAVILLAVLLAVTYLAYRAAFTLNLTGWYATTVSLLLYAAESYGCLLMFLYFFQIWDTSEPAPVPIIEGRTVDVFIPTYNEDIHLLRGTIEAAKRMDYPHKTYVLDDGRRPHVKALCEELGVEWIIRDNNLHAKAGNMNHALDITDGEFIIVFDADHIATRNFITRIIGYFADDRLAFIQTPHSYYNFDNYQATVDFRKKSYWEEGQIFYNVIQPGKNYWNAVSFCGSAAMFRRSALKEVGMVATETITEDMHTGLRMHAKGWRSLFVNERLTLGQAAPDVMIFGPQRLRWGEGNLSVMAYNSPFTEPGLTLAQRLNYIGSMLCWTTGIPKLILYLTPVLMLFTGVAPLQDFAWTYGAVTISYLLSTWLAVKVGGNGYGNIWEIETTAMAYFWTQVMSTYRAVLKRKSAKFVVTNKRGGGGGKASPLSFVYPQLAIIFLSLTALFWAGLRLMFGLSHDYFGFGLGALLVGMHVALGLGVIRRALQPRTRRFSYRHPCNTIHVAAAWTEDQGRRVETSGISLDVNERGVGFMAFRPLPVGTVLDLRLTAGPYDVSCRGEVKVARDGGSTRFAREGQAEMHRIGVQFVDLQTDQIRQLWDLSTFYACERTCRDFEQRKPRRWFGLLPPKEEVETHLPARIGTIDDAFADLPADRGHWVPGVTATVTSVGMSVELGNRLPDATTLGLTIDTPFGRIEGTGRITGSHASKVGLETLWIHEVEFVRFEGTSRGRLLSLTGAQDAPAIRNTVAHIPGVLPTPWVRPTVTALSPAFAACLVLFGFFQWKNADYILLTRINNGVLIDSDTAHRVDGIVDKVLAQRTFAGADQVVLLRRALLVMGRQEDAARLAGILIELAPNDVYARAAWADHLAKHGKLKEAEAQLGLLLKDVDNSRIDPQVRRQILLSAARISVHLHDDDLAVQRFRRYLEIVPDDRDVLVEFAGVLIASKRMDEALAVLRDLPLDRQGKMMLVSAYSAQQEFAAARKVCAEIVAEFPKDLEVMKTAANLAVWDKDYPAAVAELKHLHALVPDDYEIELLLARAYLWDKQYGTALDVLAGLAERHPERIELWEDYVRAAANVPRLSAARGLLLDEAVRHLTHGAKEHPELWADLAEAYFRMGESRRSVDLLEEVVSVRPTDAAMRLRLADMLHDLGEFKRADVHYKVLLSETQSASASRDATTLPGKSRGPLRANQRDRAVRAVR